VLGAAAIPYGSSAADLTRTIDALSSSALARAAEAARQRRAVLDPSAAAEAFFAMLDEICRR
jgi:hypothetical protein